VKKDIVMPIVVLTVICMVISAALALTDSVTKPVIEAAAEARAEAARAEMIPEAEGFREVLISGLPDSVSAAYATTNDVGYVFTVEAIGYGGKMEIICGIDNSGRITMCKTLSHAETKGMGSKTADEPYRNQYAGKDSNLDGVSAVTGATISSEAYISAIRDVFAAYEIVKGASK